MAPQRCFLCQEKRKPEGTYFELIESAKVPASQKPLHVVLQHLGNCIKRKLIFQEGASLCVQCFHQICEYDNLMLNLMSFQKKLTKKLETAITTRNDSEDEELEYDGIITIEDDDQLADVFNPELDTKEEFIEENILVEVTNDESSNPAGEGEDAEVMAGRKRKSQECITCGETFKSKVLLQMHVADVHNAKVYSCDICGTVRRDEEYLELHMNLHEGKTENECRYCDKRFSRPVNTLRHMRKHWDKKKYQCEKCGERFSQDNMLYNHRLRHEAEENPLICSICNQSFKSRKTYNHHVLIHQEDRPRHHCNVCSKSFTERYTLKMHMKTHGEVAASSSVQPEESSQNDTFNTTVELDDEARDLVCVICAVKHENKEALEEHLQQDHDVILK